MANLVFKLHLQLISVVLLGHLVAHGLYPIVDHQSVLDLLQKLDLVQENSIPNFFSAAALLVTAGAAGLIASASRLRKLSNAGGWITAAAVLLLMAADEGAGLHDLLAEPVQRLLHSSGLLFIGWVVPYAFLTCLVAWKLLPLALSLSAATRNRLVLAAAVYVCGAMGFEMLEAALMDSTTQGGLAAVDQAAVNMMPTMVMLVTVEEVLEMLGVALALRALLIHLTQELGVEPLSEVFSARAAERQARRITAIPTRL